MRRQPSGSEPSRRRPSSAAGPPAAGGRRWLEELPALVDLLEAEWSIRVGEAHPDAREAFVAPEMLRTADLLAAGRGAGG